MSKSLNNIAKTLISILLVTSNLMWLHAQTQNYLNHINYLVENNTSDKITFDISGDSLVIIYHIPIKTKITICLDDIYSVCAFEQPTPSINLYIMNKIDVYPASFRLRLTNNIADSIVYQFKGLFSSVGKTPLLNNNVWYQNDLVAVKLSNRIKVSNPDTIWGIDSSYTGNLVYKYPHNKMRFDLNLTDNIFDGEQKNYYINGNLASIENYKLGKKNGQFIFYSYTGSILVEQNYKDGQLNGKSKEWWPNGQLKSEKIFKKGQLLKQAFWDALGKTQQ